MKKWCTAALAIIMALGSVTAYAFDPSELPFEIMAKSALIMDAQTGEVLLSKNGDEKLDASSVTKIMSILLIAEAFESGQLKDDDLVQVNELANVGGMTAFLQRGDSYKASELFRAMLINSANDAAMALSIKCAGTVEAFVSNMNKRASELGIAPIFINSTGHKAQGQLVSAKEAAIIAKEVVKHSKVLEHSKIYISELIHKDGRKTELVNPNRLVRFYNGCDGLITGSNSDVGYSGIFTAQKQSRYIVVVLGAKDSKSRFDIAQKMLDYASANFKRVNVIEEGKGIARDIPIEGGMEQSVHGIAQYTCIKTIKSSEESSISKEVVLDKPSLIAPVKKGDKVGELKISLNGKLLESVPIVAANDVVKADIVESLKDVIWDFLNF